MEQAKLEVAKGPHFSGVNVGALQELDHYSFFHPLGKGKGYPGKLFLKAPLELTGMEVSLNKLSAQQSMPFHHTHREHEELYIFLKGRGQFMIDGTVLDITEGSAIRVAPKGVRTWRNTSEEDLYYIVIQAKASSLEATDIEDGMVCPEKVSWPA